MANLCNPLQKLSCSPCYQALSNLKRRVFYGSFLARQIIPQFWKSSKTPNITLWIATVKDIMRIEEIIALDFDYFDKYKTL